MNRTLYLIRHGTTEDNHLKRYPAGDPALSAKGKQAVTKLKPFLPARGQVFSSPSLRTLQTCAALDLVPQVQPDLREMDFGTMAGHTWAELETLHGTALLHWLENMQNPESETGAPGGESGQAFHGRVQKVLESLPAGESILVTHLGVIRTLLKLTLQMEQFELFPASLTVLSEFEGRWTLKHLNVAFPEQTEKSIFISGGARSGKSAFAERCAAATGGTITFIATAQAFDEEMADRISRHQRDRPASFQTIEEPTDLLSALEQASGPVLLDCLSLWVSNLMVQDRTEAEILERARLVCKAIQDRSATTVVVSNEVGLGIVPVNPMARQYRDILGRVNQMFSASCTESYFCVSGQALKLK